jgi:hypothetical protein
MEKLLEENDWQTLTRFFPEGWQEKAKELGAIGRFRKFKDAGNLLRVLLIHLADDCSLVETVTRARLGNLASISDVALLKRVKLSSEWFRWMSLELVKQQGVEIIPPDDLASFNVKTVDASVITEPGSTGTDWRLHYSMKLFSLECDEFIVSGPEKGESLTNFRVGSGDLVIGDKIYGNYKGFKYVIGNGGHFLTNYRPRSFTIYDGNGNKVDLLDRLGGLVIGGIFELKAFAGLRDRGGEELPVRICAIKKSDSEAERSIKASLKEKRKKQKNINPGTLEYHRYITVVSSLPDSIGAGRILELYRLRWQVELAFKRLKGIFSLGHLPKKDKEAARAWLHGKLFVALLAQRIVDESQLFSPWGYPMPSLRR